MRCSEFRQRLPEWLDGALGAETERTMAEHRADCAACAAHHEAMRRMPEALRDLPAPEMPAGLAGRLAARARARRTRTLGVAAAAAIAIVAIAPAAWILTAGSGQPPGEQIRTVEADKPVVQLPLNQLREVRLALSSREALEGATLTLRLPESVELDGYAQKRVLRWQTNLAAGDNRLTLPLIAHERGTREIVARIEHQGRTREFRLQVQANGSEKPDALNGARRPGPEVLPIGQLALQRSAEEVDHA